VLTPATYSGVQKQPIGSLSKATFEKPLDIFKKRAPFGQIDEVRSVSASVALGCPVPLGTGKVVVEEDLENMRSRKAIDKVESVPCEPVESKVQFQIESEDGDILMKDIELNEEMFKEIGANIQKEIENIKAKSGIKEESEPEVTRLLDFVKSVKI
jgi:hypothetical protein